jgi:transposase
MSSKAHRARPIKSSTLVVGIDVAKRSHVAVVRFPDGSFNKPFAFSNDRRGFERLLTRVESAVYESDASSTLFAAEATGHYGHALQYYLVSLSAAVVGINPAHTKRVKEIMDGSPEKSDRKDAMVIADLAAQGRGRPLTVPVGVYAELRRLGKLREQLAGERTRHLNRYTGLVDLVFPELAALVPNITCHTVRCLMSEFPTAADIARRQWRRIRRLLWKWSIGHFSEDRCRQIHEAAKESVGVREGLDAIRLQMRLVLSSLRSVESQIAEVERAQEEALRQVPYAELLLTIPEVAPTTVATILGETGDLRHYRSAAAVIKLSGLNLYTLSSGRFRGRTRITKRGRPLLRRILYMAALRMCRQGRPLREFRDRLVDRIAKPQVTVACCRKLLRLMYAMVRDGVAYQPGRLAVSDPEQAAA